MIFLNSIKTDMQFVLKACKVILQYLFKFVILFKSIFYPKFNFKVKIDLMFVLLKPEKKYRKPGKMFKNLWQPANKVDFNTKN